METEAERERAVLHQLLTECGITQADLARLTKSSPVTVNRWFVDRKDSSRVPGTILAFLSSYSLLDAVKRKRVRRSLGVVTTEDETR